MPGDTLEKKLRKPVSQLASMVTSLTSITFAYLEFKDDSGQQILFMGENNNRLFSFLKTFKADLEFRVQKAVVLRCFQDAQLHSWQVNMTT